MRFLRAALCIILLASPPAFADAVRVLGGEHADFTRLVLHLPSELNWSQKKTENSVSLVMSGQDTTFDISKAFERIRRDRISSLAATPGVLEISLGCQCEVSIYRTGQRMLVVDVRSEPENQALPPPRPSVLGSLKRSEVSPPKHKMAEENFTQAQNSTIEKPHPQVQGTERKLLEQLSRATNMGLLELSPSPPQKQPNSNTIPLNDAPKAIPRSNVTSNLPVHSALQNLMNTPDVSDSGIECIADTRLEIADWQVGENFPDGLSKLRKSLGGEITPINQESALRMVRHYLSYGFGAEAIALLREMENSEDGPLLESMAMTIDQIEGVAPINWNALTTCKGRILLWALASGGDFRDLDTKSVALNFTYLPEDLQNLLGPRIAERLLKLSAKEEADFILGNVARQQMRETAEYHFANAKSHLHEGNAPKATAEFSATVQSEAPISAEALIQLILTELDAKRPVSDETLELLIGYAYQYRDEEIAQRLNRTLFSAQLAAGHFADAWTLRETFDPDKAPTINVETEFLTALVEAAPDFEFMRYSTSLADQADGLPPGLSLSVARRFLDLGFPDMASKYLNRVSGPSVQRDRRLLQAEILLATGNHLAAKAELLGLRGEDVDQLLTRARSAEPPNRQFPAPPEKPPLRQAPSTLAEGHDALNKSRELRSRLEEILAQTSTNF